MRYSDIYLMFAEAQNALTGPDVLNEKANMSPRQALEKVRERAFGTGSSEIKNYDSDFFTAIVNERAWEFACENVRRLLYPTGYVGTDRQSVPAIQTVCRFYKLYD